MSGIGLRPDRPYPASCSNFNQLGIRVPFIVVSPFAKPHYVSHTVGDHASLLALIEQRFLTVNGVTQHLTKRDQYENPLLDMFDFNHSPSLGTTIGTAAPPAPVGVSNQCLYHNSWLATGLSFNARIVGNPLPWESLQLLVTQEFVKSAIHKADLSGL